jgi:hypothetical protein
MDSEQSLLCLCASLLVNIFVTNAGTRESRKYLRM